MSESLHTTLVNAWHAHYNSTIRKAPRRSILALSLYPEGIAMPYKRIVSLLMALSLAAIVGASAAAAQEREAEVALQRALHAEQVEGDLERAIQLYSELVENYPAARDVAAKAQLHIGLCYEKLGLTEARQAYRSVIDDFPEQRGEVAIAQERLASLTQELAELSRKPTFRKIEIASKPQNGVLSPDGTSLAFISLGGVWIVPLHGNVDPDIAAEPVRIADVPGIWDVGSLLSWSADGEWIAVNGSTGEPDGDDAVYVVSATGGQPRRVEMPERGGPASTYRLSLSPDGQRIAFSAVEPSAPESHHCHAYVISSTGGNPQRLSSAWSCMPAFSTDGEHVAYVGFRERDDQLEETGRSRFDGDLWIAPSAGGEPTKLANISGRLKGPVWSPDGRFIAAHHLPGGSGDSKEVWVFPLSADRSAAGEPIKIGLPRSSWNIVAGWTPHGELGVFINSESHQAIYTVPALGGKAVQVSPEVQWPYYPRWSPDGDRIYFRRVRPEENPTVDVVHVPAAGGEVIPVDVRSERWLVSRVPGGGLNVSPQGDRLVVSAYQEPYDPEEGVDVWSISLAGASPIRLTTDRSFEGYPCWSPDGRWIAFRDSHMKSEDEGYGAVYVVPAEGGEITQITSEVDSVGRGAIAFSPEGERIAFFSGNAIKVIPLEGGSSEVLLRNVESNYDSQLAWSPDGSRIAHDFGGKIWITPLDGGVPQELRTGLPDDAKLGDVSWSPDGERVVFVASIGGEAEFWLISNFLP